MVRESIPVLGAAFALSALLIGAAILSFTWARPLAYLAGASVCGLLILVWFFRDPEREPEPERLTQLRGQGKGWILSPADGKITDIKEENGMRRVGIFLSIFNCHVQRVPLEGRVTAAVKKDGLFLAAFKEDASKLNASSTLTVENTAIGSYRVRQITGLLARRIITHPKIQDSLKTGERYGMILLGSRVELELPKNIELLKGIGDAVYAGKTVLASYSNVR